MKSPAELTEIFRASGRKVTPQRQSVFRALHQSANHPTAEAVYETVRQEMPTISLRTVYQTLNDLAAMGEIHAVELGTGSARFDPTVDRHHHLVCIECGWVGDVAVDDVEVGLPAVGVPTAAATGFEVDATEVVFRGRCASCVAAVGAEAGA